MHVGDRDHSRKVLEAGGMTRANKRDTALQIAVIAYRYYTNDDNSSKTFMLSSTACRTSFVSPEDCDRQSYNGLDWCC